MELAVDHVFACDVNYASREFIARNSRPRALFADILARGTISHCLLAERPRMVPSKLDIYVAGFPCKDFSLLNSGRTCLQGPNASIFHGVVNYIRCHQPVTFILENVSGLTMSYQGGAAPIHEVMRTLRAVPKYAVRGFVVNTLHYQLPQNRKRVYIVGVHTGKAQLRQPLEAWGKLLRSLEQKVEATAHDFLLNDSEPEVRAELQRLLKRQEERSSPASTHSLSPRPDHAAGVQHAAAAVKLRGGKRAVPRRRGLRWVRLHQQMREKLGLEQCQAPAYHGPGWARFLLARGRDVLELAGARIARREGQHAERTQYIAEISRGIIFTSLMSHVTPCITTSSRLWVFNRSRWMVGVEKLALQGFPVDSLDLTGLSESDVAMLAGNAMTVPVVGAFLYLLLALVRFPSDPP